MNRSAVLSQAMEDAHGYWQTHQDAHVRNESLNTMAELESQAFFFEQIDKEDPIDEEDRIAYRNEFILRYMIIDNIAIDMERNPQDYEEV